jgi:hypothetical protein
MRNDEDVKETRECLKIGEFVSKPSEDPTQSEDGVQLKASQKPLERRVFERKKREQQPEFEYHWVESWSHIVTDGRQTQPSKNSISFWFSTNEKKNAGDVVVTLEITQLCLLTKNRIYHSC